MPVDVEEKQTDASHMQQLVAVSAPDEAHDAGAVATTKMTIYLRISNWIWGKQNVETDLQKKDNTSILSLFSLFQESRDESDEDQKSDDEEEEISDDEEMEPDEAFVLEGASTTLVCRISFKLMTTAVIAMDTHSYQKEALEEWVEHCKAKELPLTSPLTGASMDPQMMSNQTVRVLVREHIASREQAWKEQLAEEKKRGRRRGR